MFKNLLMGLVFAAAAVLGAAPALAAVPTLQEVYQAAQQGRMDEAQSMMDQVLKAHPDSAKAHYVEAELLARQGQQARAANELQRAEVLEPGLAFAKPEAVAKLRAAVAAPQASRGGNAGYAAGQQAPVRDMERAASSGGISGPLLIGGLALVAFIVFATRFMRRRTTVPAPGYPGAYAGSPGTPVAQPFATGPAMGPAGSGIGSGIMGGLATGAALGAGMVAGQALAHHFTDGDRSSAAGAAPSGNDWAPDRTPFDMGGTDFGVVDNGSWDDGGGIADLGGGDDWS